MQVPVKTANSPTSSPELLIQWVWELGMKDGASRFPVLAASGLMPASGRPRPLIHEWATSSPSGSLPCPACHPGLRPSLTASGACCLHFFSSPLLAYSMTSPVYVSHVSDHVVRSGAVIRPSSLHLAESPAYISGLPLLL